MARSGLCGTDWLLPPSPGLRHVSILKLLGVDPLDTGGVLELYPINGKRGYLSYAQ